MKVIRKGKPPGDRPWTGTCTSCRSIIRAKRNELSVEDSRDGEFGRAKCPVCGAEMIFYGDSGKAGNR